MSERRPGRGAHRMGSKLALAFGAFLLPLVLVELGLRVTGYDPLGALEQNEWRQLFVRPSANPLLVYELTPGASGFGWACEVEVNAHGFRDRDYALEKPADVQRIVALGDSLTFGNMLPVAKTWPKVLERNLALVNIRAEVLNLGVGGYDTLEEVAFLEQVGLAFDPDVVVVGYCVNDAGTVSLNQAYIEGVDRYRSWIYRSRLLSWLRLRLDRQSLERGFRELNEGPIFAEQNRGTISELGGDARLAELMARLGEGLAADPASLESHPLLPWYASPPHVGHLRFAFERLARLRDEHGFAVVIAVLPYLVEEPFTEQYDLAYDIVNHEARRVGFDTVDLRGDVREMGGATLRVVPHDHVHFDIIGNRLIGRRIASELVERGVIER